MFRLTYFLLVSALPQHLLSWLVKQLTRCTARGWKNFLIRRFCRFYRVNLHEAERNHAEDYASFNDFFTRALGNGARSWPLSHLHAGSPVDGRISQIGRIRGDQIVQAKGHDYGLTDLLGGNPALAAQFAEGEFATLYLSPRDYHRIHMPIGGTLRATWYIPGRLFPVNTLFVDHYPGVFACNERLVCLFATAQFEFAVILVGALFVGSMQTVWSPTPASGSGVLQRRVHRHAPPSPITLARGAEMGRFNMGSTVILLFPRGCVAWDAQLTTGSPIRLGQTLAHVVDRK